MYIDTVPHFTQMQTLDVTDLRCLLKVFVLVPVLPAQMKVRGGGGSRPCDILEYVLENTAVS